MRGCYVAGADPELMVINAKGGLVSGIPLIAGTKEKPLKVPKGALQHDNVMVEANFEPAGSSEELEENVRTVLRELAKRLHPHRLLVRASADYPETALEHPEARVFGCDPDFDAWEESMNQIDSSLAHRPLRSAGGHYHVGYKDETREMLLDPYGKMEVVKSLDIFLGIPSLFLDPDPSAPLRRSLYGKAGAHRPKDYGVEYRALGNFWIRSPALVQVIYSLADTAVRLTSSGGYAKLIKAIGAKEVVRVINSSEVKAAHSIFDSVLRPYIPNWVVRKIEELSGAELSLYKEWGI